MSAINFKTYAVRVNNVVNVDATLEKFKTELTQHVENLEPDQSTIQNLVDQVLLTHREESVNADYVASQVAERLSARASAFSPLKRNVLSFLSDNTKGETSRYVSARGRNSGGLRFRESVLQQLDQAAAVEVITNSVS